MSFHASGTFDVKLTPQSTVHEGDPPPLGRMSIDKTFHGDLEAHSVGEMLAAMTPVQGSAGYVAIERVTGSLAGREGAFTLQHSGTMDRGRQSLDLHVIPDSATGALAGLTGSMQIRIENKKHFYTFDYTLPAGV